MFVKRLELFGFKSFAEKTRLDFEAGVTAIVGPNGCGKSNISDAIKWVLGEQSVKSLRGGKMEDIIFHGADNVAGVGFSEVSLTISNQNKFLPLDYEEVTITRRIFRSGESEYLINKIPVRLKDIQEVLMGTGMGMNAYSLMEQGRVDQILSSRPEERRAIFEEASGITKYKSKKEEALRKLERTHDNLQRLGDIICEVSRQIKSIQRQVQKARRYKEEFEQLKTYELKASTYQFGQLHRQKHKLETESKEFQTRDNSLSSGMERIVQDLEKAKGNLSAVEEEISRIQAENYQLSAAFATTENKISLNQERIEEFSKRKKDFEQQLKHLQEKIRASYEQTKDAQSQIERIGQNKKEKSLFITQKQEQINQNFISIKEVQEKINQDKAVQMDMLAEETNAKNEITKLQANLANLHSRLRRMNLELEKTIHEEEDVQQRDKLCNKAIEELKEEAEKAKEEIEKLKGNLSAKQEKRHKLSVQFDDISHRTTSLQSRLDFLKELTKKYEGFSQGVKSLLSAVDAGAVKIKGFCGAVANLIEVSGRYHIPIEMALGENTQTIVVETKEAAVEAIDYLRSQDAGRANFICLENIVLEKPRYKKPKSAIGEALEFVKADSRYLNLLRYLLGGTFVMPDLQIARQAFKELDSACRMVTLEGGVFSKTLVSGGSIPRDSAATLLGRRERIKQTEQELIKAKEEKKKIEKSIAGYNSQIKRIESQIQNRQPCLNDLKINVANKESEKGNIEAAKKRFEEELSILNLEINETNEEIENLESEKKRQNEEILHLEDKKRQLLEGIQNYQEEISRKNQEQQDALVGIAEAKTELTALDREEDDAKVMLQMMVETQTEQKQVQEGARNGINDAGDKIKYLEQEIGELKEETGRLAQSKTGVEEKLNQNMLRRQKLNAEIQQMESSLKNNQKELDQVKNRESSLQLQLTEIGYKQDALKERIQHSYQVDLEGGFDENVQPDAVEPFVAEEIERLKERLEKMGPVNLVAIEENEQLEQRYSFLNIQQEDLIKAQDSLRKAISQINQTARKVFAETFEKIQGNFKEYFRILFGGGDARIILVDENNILESGIEIIVRPPGKRLQNISLLSGGEKAMTAIALLFSLFKVRPSPFCILDEVDAPLDEANIDRFTSLLSDFIKASQFIIITHNKKTINMADAMYGITMERSGISKIVSVRFAEDDTLALQT